METSKGGKVSPARDQSKAGLVVAPCYPEGNDETSHGYQRHNEGYRRGQPPKGEQASECSDRNCNRQP